MTATPLIRIAAIVGGIAVIFLLLFATRYVVAAYWLPRATRDDDVDGAGVGDDAGGVGGVDGAGVGDDAGGVDGAGGAGVAGVGDEGGTDAGEARESDRDSDSGPDRARPDRD